MIKRTVEELEAENAELRARNRRLEDYLFTKPAEAPPPSPADEALKKRLEELAAAVAKGLEGLTAAIRAMPSAPVPYVPPVQIFPNVPPWPTINPSPWQPVGPGIPGVWPTWTGDPPPDLYPSITCRNTAVPGGVTLVSETRFIQ